MITCYADITEWMEIKSHRLDTVLHQCRYQKAEIERIFQDLACGTDRKSIAVRLKEVLESNDNIHSGLLNGSVPKSVTSGG